MRGVIACVLTLLSMFPALKALEGRLLYRNGTPIIGAQLSISEHPGIVQTDDKGHFTWLPNPTVPFEIIVVLPDGSHSSPILVKQITKHRMEVTVTPLSREDVTVTAGTLLNTRTTPANAIVLLKKQNLVERQATRLTETVQHIPGVSHISEGHSSVPSIRGLARGRTLILVNRARVTTERRAGASASFLDPFFLESVEVIRGPSSVSYGSDAFGGVIHALTRMPTPESSFKARFIGSLGGGLPERSAGLALSQGLGSGSLIFMGRARNYGDYQSTEGTVENSSARNLSFLTGAQFHIAEGLFSINLQTDRGHDRGRPTLRSKQIRTFYPEETSDRLTMSYESGLLGGFSNLQIDGFWGHYSLATKREQFAKEHRNRQVQRSQFSANDFGLRFQGIRSFDRTRLELGVDLNSRFNLESENITQIFDADGITIKSSSSIENASKTNLAPFISSETLLTTFLSISAGARLDRISSASKANLKDFKRSSRSLSGFLALVFRPLNPFNATVQLSQGFREPSLSDRYFQGVSGRGLVWGNPHLDPETSRQWDVSVRWAKRSLHWALFLYQYRIFQLVERFEKEPGLFFFRNHHSALLRGMEFVVDKKLISGLSLGIGGQMSRGHTEDSGTPLDDIPSPSITILLKKQLGEKAYFALQSRTFSRNWRAGPTETITPGFGVLDLNLGWLLEPRTQLRIVLKNLTDKNYPASPDRWSVPAPGRSILLNLMVTL